MELKFESGLWIKIILSLGSEYLMEQTSTWTDSNHNNTEIPADPHEDQMSQTSVNVIAARSKAKAKPQKREPVDTSSIIPMHERKWIDIEPSEPSRCVRIIEESDQSSLTQSNSTAERRWSNSILEN